MTPEELARLRRSRPEVGLGTLRIDLKNGRPVYTVPGINETYDDLDDALGFLEASKFRKREIIRPGTGLAPAGESMYPYGWYRYTFLEQFADVWKTIAGPEAHVVRDVYGLDLNSVDHFERSMKKHGQYYGLPIVDDDKVSIMRLMRRPGEEATYDEIIHALREGVGLEIHDKGTKAFKRLKVLMNLRGLGTFEEGKRFRVGLFDPTDASGPMRGMVQGLRDIGIREADDVMKAAMESTEGMTLISTDVLGEMHTQLRGQAAKLLRESRGKSDMVAIEKRRMGYEFKQQAADFARMLRDGKGRFNARMMGFDYEMIGDSANEARQMMRAFGMDLEQGQIKGDFILAAQDVIDRISGQTGLHALTALHNVKQEIGMSKARLLTLEPHEVHKRIFMDVQTASGMPGIFDPDRLVRHQQGLISSTFDALSTDPMRSPAGRGLRGALEEMLAREIPDDPAGKLKLLTQQQYARKLTDLIDSGEDLTNYEFFLRRFFKGYAEEMQHIKPFVGSVPHFELQDAFSAGITNKSAVSWRSRLGDLAPGQVGYDAPTQSFVLTNEDIVRYYEAFGGWDQDDYLNAMLRYDKASRRIKLVGYRQPNAMGEYGLFDVHKTALREFLNDKGVADPAVDGLLKDRISTMRVFNRKRRALDQAKLSSVDPRRPVLLENDLNAITTKLEEIDSAINARMTELGKGLEEIDSSRFPAAISFKNGEYVGREIDEAGRMAGADPRLLFQRVKDGSKMDLLDVEAAFKQARAAAENRHTLGKYSNARMLLDTWLTQNDFSRLGVGRGARDIRFNVVTQETAIDMMINPGAADAAGFKGGVDMIRENMLRDLGYFVTRAKFGEGLDTGLDPWMLSTRAQSDEAQQMLIEGMQRAYRELGMDPDEADLAKISLAKTDPRAHMTRLSKRWETMLTDYTTDYEQFLSEVEPPDYLLNRRYTDEELQAARGYLSHYDDLLRTHVTDLADVGDEILDAETAKLMFDEEARVSQGFETIHSESLRYLTQHFEDGVAGKKVQRILGAAFQVAHQAGRRSTHALMQHGGSGVTVFDLTLQAIMRARETDGLELNEVQRGLLYDRDRIITRADALAAAGPLPSVEPIPGAARATAMEEVAEAAAKTKNPLVDLAQLKRLWEVGSVRKGAAVAGGLVAASLLYTAVKERDYKDLEGPPLLPDGSSYEAYPSPYVGGNSTWQGPNASGVTYQVYARGSFDPNTLGSQLEGIAGGPVSGNVRQAPKDKMNFFDFLKERFTP